MALQLWFCASRTIPILEPRISLTRPVSVWYILTQGRLCVYMVFTALPRATTPSSPHHRFLFRLFSSTYKTLFPQPLSFLIYTKPRGCGGLLFEFFNFRPAITRKSFRIRSYPKAACNSFRIRFYEKCRRWGGNLFPFQFQPRCCTLFRGGPHGGGAGAHQRFRQDRHCGGCQAAGGAAH